MISLSVSPFPFSNFIEKVIISDAVDDIGVGLSHKKIEKFEGKSFLSQKMNPLCSADTSS